MKRISLEEAYKVPDFYQPPLDTDLSTNTEYPNLNSREYRYKVPDGTTVKLGKFWESFDVNDVGNIVLATNNLRARIWNGSFWGFENVDDVGNEEKASYKIQIAANITNIRYMEQTMVIAGDTNGAVHLWSTQADARCQNGYCLFNIGSRAEHTGIVQSLELFSTNFTKAVTGSSDGCIKLWDTGAGDLLSLNTYGNAHAASVSGISTKKTEDGIFATSSYDKSFYIWDHRIFQPVINSYDLGKFGFSTIYWSDSNEHNEQLLLGDQTGQVFIVDLRNLSDFIHTLKPFTNEIHKIKFKNSLCAVLGNSNQISVMNTAQNYENIFENVEAEDYVRDIYWCNVDEFYSIGWDSQMRKHKF